MTENIIWILVLSVSALLIGNKTFFVNTYEISEELRFFIPRFSFYCRESNKVAVFYSLKSAKLLKKEISEHCSQTENYKIENKGIFRKIYITYKVKEQ